MMMKKKETTTNFQNIVHKAETEDEDGRTYKRETMTTMVMMTTTMMTTMMMRMRIREHSLCHHLF